MQNPGTAAATESPAHEMPVIRWNGPADRKQGKNIIERGQIPSDAVRRRFFQPTNLPHPIRNNNARNSYGLVTIHKATLGQCELDLYEVIVAYAMDIGYGPETPDGPDIWLRFDPEPTRVTPSIQQLCVPRTLVYTIPHLVEARMSWDIPGQRPARNASVFAVGMDAVLSPHGAEDGAEKTVWVFRLDPQWSRYCLAHVPDDCRIGNRLPSSSEAGRSAS